MDFQGFTVAFPVRSLGSNSRSAAFQTTHLTIAMAEILEILEALEA
jgi:hypothetical protein